MRWEVITISEKIEEWKINLPRLRLCYGAEAKEETTSSTWVTSQDDPAMEITHSEGMGLNGL